MPGFALGCEPTVSSSPESAPDPLPIMVDGEPVQAEVTYGPAAPAVTVDGVAAAA